MTKERNHFALPRNAFNMKKLYTLYILKELSLGKKIYGKMIYDNVKEFFMGYPVSISYSTIYNTLHKMEEENFVVSHWDENSSSTKNRSTRYYRITDDGLHYYRTIEKDTIDSLLKTKEIVSKFIEFLE
ncbi:PadR family transcriptional regulator [Peptostreptococcaceae bacterium AGR-M142]